VPLVPMPMSTSAGWPLTVTVRPWKPLRRSETRPATSVVSAWIWASGAGKSMKTLGRSLSRMISTVRGALRVPHGVIAVTEMTFSRSGARGKTLAKVSSTTSAVITPTSEEISTVPAFGATPEITTLGSVVASSTGSSTGAWAGMIPLTMTGGAGTMASPLGSARDGLTETVYSPHCERGGSKVYVADIPSPASETSLAAKSRSLRSTA